jgi:hypothetical protein
MGTTDANGILFMEETDSISPFQTLINAHMQSVTDALDATPRIFPVANEAARTAALAAHGASASLPLFVYRIDLESIEMTKGGGTPIWRTVAGGTSYPITVSGSSMAGDGGNPPRVVRNGNQIYLDGRVNQVGTISYTAFAFSTLGSIPVSLAPPQSRDFIVSSKGTTATVRVSNTGAIQFSVSYSGSQPPGQVLDLAGAWEKN